MDYSLTINKLDKKHSYVILQGWVDNVSVLNKKYFFELRDSTGFIRVFYKEDILNFLLNGKGKIKKNDYVEVYGELIWDSDYPDINADKVKLIKSGYKRITKAQRHIELAQTKYYSILKIRQYLISGLEKYLQENGYLSAHPPLILPKLKNTGFNIDFYGKSYTLSESGALYMSALALALGRVYSIHPIFRAENFYSKRHLSEFWMLEFEAIQIDFSELICFIEGLIKCSIKYVLKNCTRELEKLNRDPIILSEICKSDFPKMSYTEVINRLHSEGCKVKWGSDVDKYEHRISLWHAAPLFIYEFPYKLGSWTAKPCKYDTSLSVNLIATEGYGEILEGCQRQNNPIVLERKIKSANVNLNWYVDIHKNYDFIHSGAGLGIERLCQWVCGIKNIRDAIPFPRSQKEFSP